MRGLVRRGSSDDSFKLSGKDGPGNVPLAFHDTRGQ